MKNEITPSEVKRIIISKDIKELKRNLKIEKDQDIFKVLLNYIDKVLKKFNMKYRNVTYKIVGFLEELSLQEETNLIDKCNILTFQKEKIIELIKEVDKKNRTNDKKVIFLRDIANRLENLEVNITYNLKSPEIMANYNIIKHIIFQIKDMNLSKNLIEKNAYLINAYNLKSKNIFTLVVDEYINAIENHAKNDESFDLFYYDEILDKLLNTNKIKKDSTIIENCILKIANYDKSKDKNGKEQRRAIYWYKHLIKKLDVSNYEDDFDFINNMYNVSFYYKNEILKEGHQQGYKHRNILTKPSGSIPNDHIITIDDETTYDKDDALSIAKLDNDLYLLKVFIADPNSFCGRNSLLLNEARKRVETLYLDDKIIGMIPREIVEAYLSLDEEKYRLAREYAFKITGTGIIEDFKIKKRIIKVNKNYTYDQINNLMKKCNDETTEKTIENLINLRNILTKKYVSEDLISPDITSGEKLIETYMIFCNSKLAEYFANKGIPFVYRNHILTKTIDSDGINLDNLPDNSRKRYQNIIKKIEKTNLSATYSTEKKGHAGLDLSHYCHSTSPIRRYADILVNECVDNFYFSRLSDKDAYDFEEYLKKEVKHLNDKSIGVIKYYETYQKARIRSINNKNK